MIKDKYYVRYLLCTLLWLGFSINTNAQVQVGNDIDGEMADDRFGRSVSMPDAHTIAIGSEYNDGNGNNSGHVRVYAWNGSTWSQKGGDIDGEAAEDHSGHSVSMPDANTVAIGAKYNNGNGSRSGHVRVYTWDGSLWVQKGIDIDGEAVEDFSGYTISMPDANTVGIGAVKNGANGTNSGHVRVYMWDGSLWVQKGTDINGEAAYDNSGDGISMPDANTVAIGAKFNDGNGSRSGHVRVYAWNGSAWTQKGADIDGEAAYDNSGKAISMPDANTVAIGAINNNGNGTKAGHVRVYMWNGSSWIQKGIDIDGEAFLDHSGGAVSMPDANTVAIGASYNGTTMYESGHVRIYMWNGCAWIQKGIDIDGESYGDLSGYSVCMPDVNTVAIGAINNNGNGTNSGHVRVYSLKNISPIVITQNDTTICQGDSLLIGETWQHAAGVYMDTTKTIHSCDSIIIQTTLNVDVCSYPLNLKAFLGGPYYASIGNMVDLLRVNALLPDTTPYDQIQSMGHPAFPVYGSGGGETVNSTVYTVTGDDAIVDWVYIQLRKGDNDTIPIESQSALIQRDGNIVGTDGTSLIRFSTSNIPSGDSCYIVVNHRNHLGVMTAHPYTFMLGDTIEVDFTDTTTLTYVTNGVNPPQRKVDGVYTMIPGDVTADGKIRASGPIHINDKQKMSQLLGSLLYIINQYDIHDVNLDGSVQRAGLVFMNDMQRLYSTLGAPYTVLEEQVP